MTGDPVGILTCAIMALVFSALLTVLICEVAGIE